MAAHHGSSWRAPLAASPRHLLVAAVLSSFIAAPVSAQTYAYQPFAFPICTAGAEFYDISALACFACPQGQIPNAAGTGCICDGNTVLVAGACVACGAGEAPTLDKTACLPCILNSTNFTFVNPDATLGLAGGECACPPGQVVVERDGHGGLLAAKECRPCPAGTYASTEGGAVCLPCPAANMVQDGFSASCKCESDSYTKLEVSNAWWGRGTSCVLNSLYSELEQYSDAAAVGMTYTDLVNPAAGATSGTVSISKIFQQLLLPSAADCLMAVERDATIPSLLPGGQLQGSHACQGS